MFIIGKRNHLFGYNLQEDMDIELADSASQSSIELLNNAGGESLAQLVSRQIKFLDSVKDFKTFDFLKAASQLCHMDTSLTEQIWLNIFPQLWKILHERERTVGILKFFHLIEKKRKNFFVGQLN